MATPLGRETDVLGFFASLANAPYRHDFYQTMRRLECLFADKPRWGQALRPVDEPVRLGQDPDLSFAPASLARFDTSPGGGPPHIAASVEPEPFNPFTWIEGSAPDSPDEVGIDSITAEIGRPSIHSIEYQANPSVTPRSKTFARLG